MSFGDNFLKGFFGTDYLKDFTHASKTFRANGYELAPKYKFLFYVKFNLNTEQIPQLRTLFPKNQSQDLGLVVKTIDLPSYNFETDVMNQYNRKRLIQTRVNYRPISVVFHDDGSNLINQMWYNYFSYYYKDPSHKYGNPAILNGTPGDVADGTQDRVDYNARDTYIDNREINDWGYVGESYTDGTASIDTSGKPRYFNDITIYGFDQHKFTQYTLINPIITDWRHDTYDYSEGNGMMQHNMTIEYETVKYYVGDLSGETPDSIVKGFADPAHYDTVKSPLARPGSTSSILGQGGVVDAGLGVVGAISDLATGKGSVSSVLGAVQTAGRTYNNIKDKDLGAILKQEGTQIFKDGLPAATEAAIGAADGFFFGKGSASADGTVTGPNTQKPVPQPITDSTGNPATASGEESVLQGPPTSRQSGSVTTVTQAPAGRTATNGGSTTQTTSPSGQVLI